MLPNLTHLSICTDQLNFNRCEISIKNMHHILKVLNFITRSEDITYLDAAKWEQLILQDLPRLKEFEFESHQFTSAFWLERQWIYEVKINDE